MNLDQVVRLYLSKELSHAAVFIEKKKNCSRSCLKSFRKLEFYRVFSYYQREKHRTVRNYENKIFELPHVLYSNCVFLLIFRCCLMLIYFQCDSLMGKIVNFVRYTECGQISWNVRKMIFFLRIAIDIPNVVIVILFL